MVNRDTVGTNTTCDKCSPGFYNDIPGNETCRSCPIGHYQNEEGIPYCIGCIPGKYQAEEGKKECKSCDAGQYRTSSMGSTSLPSKTWSPHIWSYNQLISPDFK